MNGMHEPREQFVADLESRLTAQARFHRRPAVLPAWMPQSRSMLAIAAAVVIMVAMGIGGAAVALAYQAQTAEGRQMLTTAYQQRMRLAEAGLSAAEKLLKATQARVEVGGASRIELVDAQLKLFKAQAEMESVQLQIEEVQLTGHEPVNQISAPLMSGRDFVFLRLRIDERVAARVADAEVQNLENVQQRVAVGLADAFDLEVSRVRVRELRAITAGVGSKLSIRQEFINHKIDGALADLRVMEVDADQRVKVLTNKVELGRKDTARIAARVQVGSAQQVEAAEAQMRQLQVEYELSKANYDLMLIRRQIELRGR